jgi:hypothetical protein
MPGAIRKNQPEPRREQKVGENLQVSNQLTLMITG